MFLLTFVDNLKFITDMITELTFSQWDWGYKSDKYENLQEVSILQSEEPYRLAGAISLMLDPCFFEAHLAYLSRLWAAVKAKDPIRHVIGKDGFAIHDDNREYIITPKEKTKDDKVSYGVKDSVCGEYTLETMQMPESIGGHMFLSKSNDHGSFPIHENPVENIVPRTEYAISSIPKVSEEIVAQFNQHLEELSHGKVTINLQNGEYWLEADGKVIPIDYVDIDWKRLFHIHVLASLPDETNEIVMIITSGPWESKLFYKVLNDILSKKKNKTQFLILEQI